MYASCPACAQARKTGDLEAAIGCSGCKGTGIRRTRESWVCNACGGCLCPNEESAPYGLVEAKVSGGYGSPALSDCTNYKFSICETCLRKIFDGFTIKPKISEYTLGDDASGDVMTTEQYEEEAALRKKMDEESAASKAEFFRLYEESRCADHDRDPASENRNHLKEYCAREGAGRLLYEDASDWPYAKRWLCTRHLRDAFVCRGATIHIPGREPLSWEMRCRMGLKLLSQFQAGKSPEIASEEEASIAISTLFPLLMSKKYGSHAARELARISLASPRPALKWASPRVALSFRPGEEEAARTANDWLTWGQEQEYDNAVATAFLGYDARTIWDGGAP
jgi:hypothetical protein